ncbi:MAG: chemotaxis protein CheW [Blastocatellia bacterium]
MKEKSPKQKSKPAETAAGAPVKLRALPLELASPGSGEEKPKLVSVLLFEVGGAPYAIAVEQTEGVVDCPRVTPLPGPPDGVVGLTSVRGRMTVVMNLDSSASELAIKRRLILVKGDAQLGLLADRVEGVVALEKKKLRPLAHGKDSLTAQRATFGWPATGYFKNGGRRVPIIDVERLSES